MLTIGSTCVSAQINTSGTPWEKATFPPAPECRVVGQDSIRSLIFESLPYKGKNKSVFAYYCTPSMINGGNPSDDRNLPGIILVHGGGGTAFRDWAAMWAKRGYAAIALDTRGNGPERKHIEGGFEEPGNETPYFDITLPLQEQWVYQAAGDVINAHSLLRSFPEVDTTRTAITGISWGGVLTCITSSLDGRFKAAVPVYGCGYLWDSGKMKENLDALPEAERETWIKQYDPSNFLARNDRPLLLINGTNDVHFYLPSMAKSAALHPHAEILIKQGLRHNHKYGWSNDEIEAFINHYLSGTSPLPVIRDDNDNYDLAAGSTASGTIASPTAVKEVKLHYTTDTDEMLDKRQWQQTDATLSGNRWKVSIPADATMWYVSTVTPDGLQATTHLHYIP